MHPQDINTYDAGIIATDPITGATLEEEFPIQEGTMSMVRLPTYCWTTVSTHLSSAHHMNKLLLRLYSSSRQIRKKRGSAYLATDA